MPISLYDATVKSFIQTVGAVSAFTWRGTALSSDQLAACNTAAA